jgi:hypothetical protein
MSMPMATLNVCTLSNIRVASNTHCFVAANPLRRTVQLTIGPVYAERAVRLARIRTPSGS